jgi:hypothetical protein
MFVFINMYCKTYCNTHNANYSVAGAQTTLVQSNPGTLGIAKKFKCNQETCLIILGPHCRNNQETRKGLSTSYLVLYSLFWDTQCPKHSAK